MENNLRKVLIADDEPDILEILKYNLSNEGYEVTTAKDGDEALEKARKENKLILISIGYSACHWCHVMEHESFENESTAKIMKLLLEKVEEALKLIK